jgi:hypothetical protein
MTDGTESCWLLNGRLHRIFRAHRQLRVRTHNQQSSIASSMLSHGYGRVAVSLEAATSHFTRSPTLALLVASYLQRPTYW